MSKINIMSLLLAGMFVASLCCSQQVFAEEEGNNLSLPVIWSDGVTKELRGNPGVITDLGEWVPGATSAAGDYWWLWTEIEIEIQTITIDGEEVEVEVEVEVDVVCHLVEVGGVLVCECTDENNDPLLHVIPYDVAVPVYVQRDLLNDWQAESLLLDPIADPETLPVYVTSVDWGDNLEAKDWYYRSIIRTETILHKDISAATMTGYEMTWLEGLGVGEVWGTTLDTYDSDDATVYTGCARLTIQEFSEDVVPYTTVTVPVLDPVTGDPVPVLGSNGEPKVDGDGNIIYEEYDVRVTIDNDDLGLTWNAGTSEWGGAVMDATWFNSVVWDAGEGQDSAVYSAEINVKGKVLYGYNWNTREKSGGPGYYRITFSMDDGNLEIDLNTAFDDDTEIMVKVEDEGGDETSNETGGGIAVIDVGNNLSYIDVKLEKKSGGGGENGGGKPDPDPEPEPE